MIEKSASVQIFQDQINLVFFLKKSIKFHYCRMIQTIMKFDFFGQLIDEVKLFDFILIDQFNSSYKASIYMPGKIDHTKFSLSQDRTEFKTIENFARFRSIEQSTFLLLFCLKSCIIFDHIKHFDRSVDMYSDFIVILALTTCLWLNFLGSSIFQIIIITISILQFTDSIRMINAIILIFQCKRCGNLAIFLINFISPLVTGHSLSDLITFQAYIFDATHSIFFLIKFQILFIIKHVKQMIVPGGAQLLFAKASFSIIFVKGNVEMGLFSILRFGIVGSNTSAEHTWRQILPISVFDHFLYIQNFLSHFLKLNFASERADLLIAIHRFVVIISFHLRFRHLRGKAVLKQWRTTIVVIIVHCKGQRKSANAKI